MIHFNGYILNFSELVLVNIVAFFTPIFKSPHITIYIFLQRTNKIWRWFHKLGRQMSSDIHWSWTIKQQTQHKLYLM